MNHDRARELLEKQFSEGPLPPLESQALRAHLRNCAPCKDRYDRLAQLERGLPGDGQLARMLARGAPPRPQERPSRRGVWVGLAAAAAVLIALPFALRETPPDIGIKGGGGVVEPTVRLFVRSGDSAPRPLKGAIKGGDGLLVSYTNPSSGPTHLAVMARDSGGRIFWLAPTWADPQAKPKSLAIVRGVADKELPQVVYHAFRKGPVEVCAVFHEGARAIPAWDAALAKGWPPEGHCQRFEVK